jgi:hypothetical protein
MFTVPSLARMTMWFIPLPDPLLEDVAEVAPEPCAAVRERLAHEAGFTRGPKGEWIPESVKR